MYWNLSISPTVPFLHWTSKTVSSHLLLKAINWYEWINIGLNYEVKRPVVPCSVAQSTVWWGQLGQIQSATHLSRSSSRALIPALVSVHLGSQIDGVRNWTRILQGWRLSVIVHHAPMKESPCAFIWSTPLSSVHISPLSQRRILTSMNYGPRKHKSLRKPEKNAFEWLERDLKTWCPVL